MKKVTWVFIVVVCIWLSGCTTRHQSGDLGYFLILKIISNGGKATASKPLPQLVGEWSYSNEKCGTAILSDKVTVGQVDRFLRAIYGVPSEGGKTPAGDVQWVVPARTAGVSIWYYKKGKSVQISIFKPLELH